MGIATHLRTEDSRLPISNSSSKRICCQSTLNSCSISITSSNSSSNIKMSPLMTRLSLMMPQITRINSQAIRSFRMIGNCNIIKIRSKICQLLNSSSNHRTINNLHGRVQLVRFFNRTKWSRKVQPHQEPKRFQIIVLKFRLN